MCLLSSTFNLYLQCYHNDYQFFVRNTQKQTSDILPICSLTRRHLLTFSDCIPETPSSQILCSPHRSHHAKTPLSQLLEILCGRRADLGSGRRGGASGREKRCGSSGAHRQLEAKKRPRR